MDITTAAYTNRYHCCDCRLWRYARDKYRDGKCKFNKHKNPQGVNVACDEHFKPW